MNLNLGNTENVELNEFQPIDAGWYNAQIIEESTRETKNGGTQLVYKFRIYGDKFNGRTVYENYNVKCQSDQAMEIARKQLAKLGKACGVANFVDSKDVLNHCCQILVSQDEYEGKVRNKITAYDYAAEESKPVATSSSGAKKNWWEK